jgi:DNA modification methylase
MSTIQLSTLIENPDNPRFIKDDKFKKLVTSVREFPEMMEARPIVIDSWDNPLILGGNMRYKALKAAGFKEVPASWVRTAEGWTSDQKREFIIKDNVGFGEWDMELISKWDANVLTDWGLDLPPFESNPETKDDNYKIPNKVETDILPGDIIHIGPHKLMCGDATNLSHWQQLLGPEQVNLVVTDPPYNVDYTGGTGLQIMNDKQEDSAFYQFLLDFHKALSACCKPGAAWYVWHADSEGANFRNAFKDSGLLLKQCLIWVKNSLVMGRQDYQWRHEPCLYGWVPGGAHYFTPERNHSTVFEDQVDIRKLKKEEMVKLLEEIFSEKMATTVLHFDKPQRNDVHPTMKPVLLIAEQIRNSSKPGDIVADGFGGSGTTMVAAHQLRREARIMELDPQYCQVIIDRMKKLDSALTFTHIRNEN